MFIKIGLIWKRRYVLEQDTLESLWVEIIINKGTNFFIASVYRSPVGSKYQPRDFVEQFNKQLSSALERTKECIVLSDLNTDYLKQVDDDSVKRTLTLNGLSQLVSHPTRITENTSTLIDIIATNRSANIKKTELIPLSFSDHDMVVCVQKINHLRYKAKYITSRNYSRYNPIDLQREMRNTDFPAIMELTNVDNAVTLFTNILSNVFDKPTPIVKKRTKGKPSPWLDADIKRDMDYHDNVLRKARKNNSESV